MRKCNLGDFRKKQTFCGLCCGLSRKVRPYKFTEDMGTKIIGTSGF